jgi:hypothetical protein
MIGGEGHVGLRSHKHVVFFAMHNLVSDTFRDSIRMQAVLRCTPVTHISTMNLYTDARGDCVGHNHVHFANDRDTYPVLKLTCPTTVIWDYNFVPAGYVVEAYKANLFSGQVPGFFACGAHMVVMPNWVLREPSKSVLDSQIVREQTKELVDGTGRADHVSYVQGLAVVAPGVLVRQMTLSAVEAETLHPLVVATIAAHSLLHDSLDKHAQGASWPVNKRYIGEKVAFIVFYDAKKIPCPRSYLQLLTGK